MYICLYPLPIPWRHSFIFLTRFLSYTPLIEAERKPFETQYENTLNIWIYFEYTLNTQYMNMIWIPVSTILSLLPTSVEWCVLLYAVCNRRVRLTKPFCTPEWMGDWYLRPSTNIASGACFPPQKIAYQPPVQTCKGLLNWTWSKWCIASKCRRYLFQFEQNI